MRYQGKIIYPCIMAKGPCFVYEEEGFFTPAPANIITGKEQDVKYLTGLLNSKFVYFFAKKFYMGGGIEGEFKTNNVEKFPIPKITESNKALCDEIIALVDRILEVKAKDLQVRASATHVCHDLKNKSCNDKPNPCNDKLGYYDDNPADTSELESQIDSLVYRLYHLTESEMQIKGAQYGLKAYS